MWSRNIEYCPLPDKISDTSVVSRWPIRPMGHRHAREQLLKLRKILQLRKEWVGISFPVPCISATDIPQKETEEQRSKTSDVCPQRMPPSSELEDSANENFTENI